MPMPLPVSRAVVQRLAVGAARPSNRRGSARDVRLRLVTRAVGLGIGRSPARRVIDMHGGHVEALSAKAGPRQRIRRQPADVQQHPQHRHQAGR